MAELSQARKEARALQSELDHPTTSRAHADQVKLSNAVKAAGEKCQKLIVELREIRKRRT
jgi:hypothetical protein